MQQSLCNCVTTHNVVLPFQISKREATSELLYTIWYKRVIVSYQARGKFQFYHQLIVP